MTKNNNSNTDNDKIFSVSKWGIAKRFLITFASTVSGIWLIFEFIIGYIFDKELFSGSGTLGLTLLILVGTTTSFVVVLHHIYSEYQKKNKIVTNQIKDQKRDVELFDTLIEGIQSAYEEGNWEEVLKIGSVLSRPLWITGRYKLRVKLGELVESAAAYSNHPKEQVQALIDDLGWTNLELGAVTEAKKNILHGIKIAEDHEMYNLAYKGYRHLSGIALKANNLKDAEAFLEKSVKCADLIKEPSLKKNAEAGGYVNMALIDQLKGDHDKALVNFRLGQKIYKEIGDRDREVKLYHFIGDLLLEKGETINAKDVFRKGLSASKTESRRDGILKNSLGIAKIAENEGELKEALDAYKTARKVSHELGLNEKVKELEAKIASINKKIKLIK